MNASFDSLNWSTLLTKVSPCWLRLCCCSTFRLLKFPTMALHSLTLLLLFFTVQPGISSTLYYSHYSLNALHCNRVIDHPHFLFICGNLSFGTYIYSLNIYSLIYSTTCIDQKCLVMIHSNIPCIVNRCDIFNS